MEQFKFGVFYILFYNLIQYFGNLIAQRLWMAQSIYYQRTQKWLAISGGFLTTCLGAFVLLGWYTKNDFLFQISENYSAVQFSTTLGIFLCGFLTFCEYTFAMSVWIDELLIDLHFIKNTFHTGRLTANTAVCLILAGIILMMLVLRAANFNYFFIFAVFGSLIFALGGMALFGYVSNLETAYSWAELTNMVVHTVSNFALSGLTLLGYCWCWSINVISNIPYRDRELALMVRNTLNGESLL